MVEKEEEEEAASRRFLDEGERLPSSCASRTLLRSTLIAYCNGTVAMKWGGSAREDVLADFSGAKDLWRSLVFVMLKDRKRKWGKKVLIEAIILESRRTTLFS